MPHAASTRAGALLGAAGMVDEDGEPNALVGARQFDAKAAKHKHSKRWEFFHGVMHGVEHHAKLIATCNPHCCDGRPRDGRANLSNGGAKGWERPARRGVGERRLWPWVPPDVCA